ncbi:MAG: PAS domain-containing sensor histidine kinase [Nitriliruptoraceae bacterium]
MSLRSVQSALSDAVDWQAAVTAVAEALVAGMRRPPGFQVEVRLDGHRAVAGALGTIDDACTADIIVDHVSRGLLAIGYVTGTDGVCTDDSQLLLEIAAGIVSAEVDRVDATVAATSEQSRLRHVLDGLPSAVFRVGRMRNVELLTAAQHFPFRRSPGALGDLAEWDDGMRDVVMTSVSTAFRGESVRKELRWRDRYWDVRFEPQYVDDTAPAEAVLVIVLDVTQQRQLRETEARLASIVASASLAIVGIDADGAVTSWNDGAAVLFGWDAGEIVGRHVGALIPSAEPSERRVEDVSVSVDCSGDIELMRLHRDGRTIHVGANVSLLRNRRGEATEVVVMYYDLTQRDEALAALAVSEEQFRLIAQAVTDVVYRVVLDPVFTVDFVSPSVEEVLGISGEDLQASPRLILERSHPEDRGYALLDTTKHGQTSGVFRWRWSRPDGRTIWVEDNRDLITMPDGARAVVGVVRDVTEHQFEVEATRKALEQQHLIADQLRRVDEMKTTFLSAVSHEVRTPLTSIVGFAETMQRLPLDSPVAKEFALYLERLIENTQRLERLIDDLLDVDRLTRGQIAPRCSPTNLAQLIRRVVGRNNLDGGAVDLDLEPVTADVDAMMIERAIDNLVRNTVRHTPSGTHLWITMRQTDDSVDIEVADNGPGITEHLWPNIFEPFVQGEHSANLPSPGTGVGLSLVQRFIELHNGTIRIGERDGGGAKFSICLPVAGDARQPVEGTEAQESSRGGDSNP